VHQSLHAMHCALVEHDPVFDVAGAGPGASAAAKKYRSRSLEKFKASRSRPRRFLK
jgi:hypothetical protein